MKITSSNQQNQTQEFITIVNEQDQIIGYEEKIKVHQLGLLHRAFSVFIINDKGETMLQKRAVTKYHSGGLWTNTCCGHPRENETILQAANRRLQEEMGIQTELKEVGTIHYQAALDHDLQENEIDHIIVGKFNDNPKLNGQEAENWQWISLEELKNDIENHPENYTIWLKIIIDKGLLS